jgi:bifunctional aspartokinase / homoserine dehydrogenase 1
MKILKFGGSSVGSPERIKQIAQIIKDREDLTIVVSAFGGTTDQLIRAAKLASLGNQEYLAELEAIRKRHIEAINELTDNPKSVAKALSATFKELEEILHGVSLTKELTPRTLDLVMSFGERLSAYIISQHLNANFLDARKIIKTNDNFNNAKVNFAKSFKLIQEHYQNSNKLNVVTGFISSTENNETTTLGRGGSDYTAAIIGAALDAEEVEIWTDVSGIMTADPRKVKKAFPIPQISYIEAMEMSHFGAKVIHPPTMQPLMNKGIPIRIKNTMEPEQPGSVISEKSDSYNFPIKGISSISNVALLRVQGSGMIGVTGVSQRLFGALAQNSINIILISQASSEHSICFAIAPEDTKKARHAIEETFELEIQNQQINEVVIEEEKSIIAVVGENMRNTSGLSSKVFSSLGQNGINVSAIAQGSSELNISIVIDKSDESKALNSIHDSLFLSKIKTLNLFLVGTGLIGSTLLEQIRTEHSEILANQSLDLRVIGVANSRKMLFEEEGITLDNWESLLDQSSEESNSENFTEHILSLNLTNSIFVDCTANESIGEHYEKLLKNSISVVTPNKKANSANLKKYLKLQHSAAKSNAKFLYETNVGAGLPIINTLQNLLFSGDKVHKIEAVLSGTLSYIFNSFDGSKPFDQVVLEAKEKGYTEPDPRDDLNGLDVARKLLILARETGNLLEMEDIEVENLVPESCRQAESSEEFFTLLKENADYFQEKLDLAKSEGKKLCYIASLENNKAVISLEAVDSNHPFYSLSGSDNIISISSKRYSQRPLVIKGPGAGAEVTAAGVFADILTVANKSFNKAAMKYSFLNNLKKQRLVISLIGMSNIGKSTWSRRLAKTGFKHICCDELIEEKLTPELQALGYSGIKEVAKWLGQPYAEDFMDKQQQFLELEKETMNEVVKEIQSCEENIVVDSTGSLIYIDEEAIKELNQNSLVIHIEPTDDMKQAMFETYIKEPKPVIWGDSYQPNPGESNEAALSRCYHDLLEYRLSKYRQHADITLSYKELDCDLVNEKEFLELITKKL